MKLTKNQIQELYKFTRLHYVAWYDLQSELVDHLANDIEQIWKQEPNLTFDEAKRKSFKKFGVFGFMDVVEERQKSLGKRYFKLFWTVFNSYFTIPKIVFTVSLFFAVLFFIRLIHYNPIIIGFLTILIIITPFVFLIRNRKSRKQKVKNKERIYMFEDNITNLGGLVGFFYLPFDILFHYLDKDIWSLKLELLFTITVVVLSISLYILIVIIPPKVRKIIAKEHPEYQISSLSL